MLRSSAVCSALLVSLAVVPTAAGRSFVVSKVGNSPSVAVDGKGTTHIVWDSQEGDTSTTHYCQVPRKGRGCAAGTERTFVPAAGDQDFAGPRVVLTGGTGVLVVTSRCCSSAQAPDGAFHSEHVFAMVSGDNGATFSAPTWFATQRPDAGSAYAGGVFHTFGITGAGTGLQAAPVAGFEGRENTVTPLLAITGGVGVSPRGSLVAFADSKRTIHAGALPADPNAQPVAFGRFGKGSDVTVTSGPRGADVFYKTNATNQRYMVRRYANGRFGRASKVSEAGYPIFGRAFQDGAGRVHAAWQGRLGLTYRRSAKTGRGFGALQRLSRKSGYFNLAVGANGKGRAVVAYDSNGSSGRVGGFTAG